MSQERLEHMEVEIQSFQPEAVEARDVDCSDPEPPSKRPKLNAPLLLTFCDDKPNTLILIQQVLQQLICDAILISNPRLVSDAVGVDNVDIRDTRVELVKVAAPELDRVIEPLPETTPIPVTQTVHSAQVESEAQSSASVAASRPISAEERPSEKSTRKKDKVASRRELIHEAREQAKKNMHQWTTMIAAGLNKRFDFIL